LCEIVEGVEKEGRFPLQGLVERPNNLKGEAPSESRNQCIRGGRGFQGIA
jgi:hypothetical protein